MKDISFWRATMFGEKELRQALYSELAALKQAVLKWPADEFLRTPPADVIDYLVDQHSVVCPQLDRDGIHQLPSGETTSTFHDIAGRPYQRQLTTMSIVVPFEGDPQVFLLRASRHTMREWHTTVADGELRVRWTGESGAHEAARRHFEEELNQIEKHLGWAQELIGPHNEALCGHAQRLVDERRAKLLTDRGMEASLGFPLRRREGAPRHAVPVKRKTVAPKPRPEASGPFQPEPELSAADYEEALRVICSCRSSLERSLSTSAKMGEEDIRNLILVSLNAYFEGHAGAELFNGWGKTDILIRSGDRNVFIAECKNWKGVKAITEALDEQLLGRYLTWRDTKAALLLFIRNGNPGEIIRKATEQIGQHPHCKRTLAPREDGQHDFIFASTQDSSREIRLAFIPFVIPSTPAPPQLPGTAN